MAAPMIFIPGQVTPRLVQNAGARATMMLGLGLIAVAMVWLTQITASTNYFEGIFGPMLLAGTGVGLLNPPLTGTIMAAVPPEDSGVASGALQAVGMIGGSVGTSILVTIFGSSIRGNPQTAVLGATAKPVLADGIATACMGGVGFAALGFLIVLLIIRHRVPQTTIKGV
jgi:MFS family permease